MQDFQLENEIIECKIPTEFPIHVKYLIGLRTNSDKLNIKDLDQLSLIFKQNGEVIDFPATVEFNYVNDRKNFIEADISIEETVNAGTYSIHLHYNMFKIPDKMDVLLKIRDIEPIPNYAIQADYFNYVRDDNVEFTVSKKDGSDLDENYRYALSVMQGPHNKLVYVENVQISEDKKQAIFEVSARMLETSTLYSKNNRTSCNLILIDENENGRITNAATYLSLVETSDMPDASMSYSALNYPEINKKS